MFKMDGQTCKRAPSNTAIWNAGLALLTKQQLKVLLEKFSTENIKTRYISYTSYIIIWF